MPGRPPREPAVADLVHPGRDGGHVLDMSAWTWVYPSHLARAAAVAHWLRADGADVDALAPSGEDPRRYAARMRLGRVLTDLGVRHGFPVVREHDRRDVLLEVRPIRDERDARALATLVASRVRPGNRAAADALHSCVAEMALNVTEHSGTVGYAAAQTTPRTGEIRFAVADAGAGLRATLRGRGAEDDRTAAHLALAGVSSRSEPGRGTGIPTTVREVAALGGHLYLVSGTALTRADTDRTRTRTLAAPVTGTLVEGVLTSEPGGRSVLSGTLDPRRAGPDTDRPAGEGEEHACSP